MPKVYKSVDLYKMLLSFWFQKISQKWSHIKLKNKDWLIVILPMHSKDIPYWTLDIPYWTLDIPYWTFLSILSQWNISQSDAKRFLWK